MSTAGPVSTAAASGQRRASRPHRTASYGTAGGFFRSGRRRPICLAYGCARNDSARYAAVQREIAEVVGLRNLVDERERAAEPARNLFDAERFQHSGRSTWKAWHVASRRLVNPKHAGIVRSLVDTVTSRRSQRIAEAANELLADAERLGLTAPSQPPRSPTVWDGPAGSGAIGKPRPVAGREAPRRPGTRANPHS